MEEIRIALWEVKQGQTPDMGIYNQVKLVTAINAVSLLGFNAMA